MFAFIRTGFECVLGRFSRGFRAATKISTGQVKNPLEYFPPKTEADVEKAKVELRDAYSKDFAEYVDKKVFGSAKK
jgi:hypothetical protein